MFSVIDGIYIIADDIIIAAATVQEPNTILRRVLERVREHMSDLTGRSCNSVLIQ